MDCRLHDRNYEDKSVSISRNGARWKEGRKRSRGLGLRNYISCRKSTHNCPRDVRDLSRYRYIVPRCIQELS